MSDAFVHVNHLRRVIDQRIYASHNSIMFSRRSCYFFVRPKQSFLEVCVFLPRAVKAPQVRRVDWTSKTKAAHIIQIRHRDEVEAPITDWLQEAYERADAAVMKPAAAGVPRAPTRKKPMRKVTSARTRRTAGRASSKRR